MSGKNLTFKLILDGDNKGLVAAAKQSETTIKAVFDAIKSESDKVKQVAESSSKAIGNIVPKGTTELADKLTQSLTAATGIIQDAGDNAKSTAGNFTDFGNKAEKALGQLKSDLVEAKRNLEAFSRTDATPVDIAVAQAQVDQLEKEVKQADQAFNDFHAEVGRANTNLKETDNAAQTAQKGISGLKTGYTALVGVMGALGVGLGIKELAEAADSYTNLSVRINIATKEGGDFASAMAGVHQVALATNSSIDTTADLFTRLNAVGKEMGMTQQQALDLTKTVTQAIQIGGSSAQAADGAIQQMIQAMQGGILRGEEFNSIMEGGYGLAEALARGLGVTTGELRKMAENGELSSERVIKALQSQADEVQATYNQFPTTIGNALQRIQTQWQVLIGTMDQANGASATVAQWLVTLADNMDVVDVLLEDIGEGFVWMGDRLSRIDTSTIEALKTALTTAYEGVKSFLGTLADTGEALDDVFNTALSALLNFDNGVDEATANTNGLTKALQLINVAVGYLSDGFTAIGIAVKLFVGGLYALGSAWSEIKSKFTWGEVREAAIREMNVMDARSKKWLDDAQNDLMNFESSGKKAWDEIGKTQEQKNAEQITNNQKTLDELKAQEQQHKSDYKAISDERIQLQQQLHDARKAGDQAAIDAAMAGLAKLDAKEREYQAESKKINDEKIQAAQEWVNAQLIAADGTQKAADAATQKTMQTTLAAQGLKLEFDSAGKAVVKAMDEGAKATENQGNATDRARKAAADIGLDLDVSLNRVSAKFKESESSVNSFVAGLEGLGVTGKQAGDVTYQAWLKWLETAKSQAEIDFAKAKLKEFGDQGQISTSQVEQGLIAVKFQAQELPDEIDPVTESFKRLGIETKENLKLAAQQALMDFINVRDSGQATAEGVQKAYERAAQAAAASGDAGRIAAVNAMNAGRNLEVQIDETGKASVKSMSDLEQSVHRVRNATSGAEDGFRNLGQTGRDEADSVKSAWEEAVSAASSGMHETRKGTKGKMAKNAGDIEAELKAMGYSDAAAKQYAKDIYEGTKGVNGYKSSGFGFFGGLSNVEQVNAELERMQQYAPNNVSTKASGLGTSSKSISYELKLGNETVQLTGSAESQSSLEAMLKQLGTLSKST